MSDIPALRRELDRLEAVQAQLATISTRTDDRRKNDLIELRRQLSAQIAEVGKLADPVFEWADDAALAREYRSIFSKMRSAAAIHQANWPAVKLGEDPHRYRESVRGVRQANVEFVAWMRDALTSRL